MLCVKSREREIGRRWALEIEREYVFVKLRFSLKSTEDSKNFAPGMKYFFLTFKFNEK